MWNVWTINDLKCTPFRHLHCLSILYSLTCINNWYLYHPFEYIDQIHVFSESRTRRHNTSQPETDIKKRFSEDEAWNRKNIHRMWWLSIDWWWFSENICQFDKQLECVLYGHSTGNHMIIKKKHETEKI